MYSNYLSSIRTINKDNIILSGFKSNNLYRGILEHVYNEQGLLYLRLIEEEFLSITPDNIINFLKINDLHGSPNIYSYTLKNGQTISCSPTSLRYVYHSLLILTHIKETANKSIVEVGCGYGGLFLAINYFSKILNISIHHYYFIDFQEVCNLIDCYLHLNINSISIPFSLNNCYSYGEDIQNDNLFLISNYCFTEIEEIHRENYINKLFNKISNGFIIWQTVFSVPIEKVSNINKNIKAIIHERPQTASDKDPNYFVYF
jgi:hypothetical protein